MRLAMGATIEPIAANRGRFAIARCNRVAPSRCRIWSLHHTFARAMSIRAGHSVWHALHATHVSITSCASDVPSSSRVRSPETTARSRFARARVECSSSPVAAAGGHITPTFLRQNALP
jgi:hypothetical protein